MAGWRGGGGGGDEEELVAGTALFGPAIGYTAYITITGLADGPVFSFHLGVPALSSQLSVNSQQP
jgi:hypothetical protein